MLLPACSRSGNGRPILQQQIPYRLAASFLSLKNTLLSYKKEVKEA